MKRVISIALILLMSAQSFYKLGVITYFQLNREFIAEFLCINKEQPITMCQGQCFLKKHLQQANDVAQSTVPTGKEKVDFPTFLISENCYTFQRCSGSNPVNTVYMDTNSSKHLSAPFHPPTFA
jgi:hypothetical protein